MKYSSQIVIKKLDNKFIFNNKDDDKNLPQLMVEGKLDTRVKVNVEWINDNNATSSVDFVLIILIN